MAVCSYVYDGLRLNGGLPDHDLKKNFFCILPINQGFLVNLQPWTSIFLDYINLRNQDLK
jgi:hypothetical protein